jgi:twitching motility protein PilT
MKIDELLTYALDSGASDLHLSTGSIPMVRMNGIMKPLNMEAVTEGEINDIMPQVMNDDQIKNFRNVKEIDFSYRIDGKGRFRVNFFEQIRGIS